MHPAPVRVQRRDPRRRGRLRGGEGDRLTGPRVAGVDPGTLSFELCALAGGEPLFEASFPSGALGADPAPLVDALVENGPFDLVLGPAGYGLPLVPAERVGEAELAQIVLRRADEPVAGAGITGMRSIVRALLAAGLPLVFGPGAIHLPTVPAHRKWNRIDLGTADKVASAALGVVEQARRLGVGYEDTAFVMIELGGAFTAALAVDGGRIVDGLGGSSGPIGARACGALDAEAAYLMGGALSKRTVFSGGALDPAGALNAEALVTSRGDPATRDGWLALEEGAVKAILAMTASVPAPREILVSGRLAAAPGLIESLAARLQAPAAVRRDGAADGLRGARVGVEAPVRSASTERSAARGAALLADGLAGGRHAPLVDCLRLREAAGGALDHLRMHGAQDIALG